MFIKKAIAFFSIFLLLLLISCKSKEVANNKNDATLTTQNNSVENKTYNKDKTMLLVTRYTNDINPRKTINYSVLDSKSKKVLKSGVFTGMKLEWFTLHQLKGYLNVGMIEKEPDAVMLKDAKNKNIVIIDIN
ncbi:hypothetical protein ES043_05000 [Polaribacter sp. IC063]|nr:hypothetical protein ES043_05000 [Polaribacter sp. IC063]